MGKGGDWRTPKAVALSHPALAIISPLWADWSRMQRPSGLQDGRDDLHFLTVVILQPHCPPEKDIWVQVSKTNNTKKKNDWKKAIQSLQEAKHDSCVSYIFFFTLHSVCYWHSDCHLTTEKKRSSCCPEPLTSPQPPGVPPSSSKFSAGPCDRRPKLQASLKANHYFFIQLTRVHLLGSEGKVSGETTSGE